MNIRSLLMKAIDILIEENSTLQTIFALYLQIELKI